MSLSSSIAVMLLFIWLGLIIGISFLEAPLKFTAPNVTLPIGLSIGRRVFQALNKVEWILLISSLIMYLLATNNSPLQFTLLSALTIIFLLQSFWLLPRLDARAQLIISGQNPIIPSVHLYYVAGEVVKVILLIILGWMKLKNS